MSNFSTIAGIGRTRQVYEREVFREAIASWYITVPGIPEEEKKKIAKSLRYNSRKSIIRLAAAMFAFMLIWAFGFMINYDPYENAIGVELIGAKEVTAIVQEDGMSASLKDPNAGEHVVCQLTELGLDPAGYSYGDRVNTYWQRSKDGQSYTFIAALSAQQVGKIRRDYYAITISSLFTGIILCVAGFFVRKRIYTGWFIRFYYRMEKFCSTYGICRMYPGLGMEEAFVSYGNEYPSNFVNKFNSVQLTDEDVREKRHAVVRTALVSVAAVVLCIAVGLLIADIQSAQENIRNEVITSKVVSQFQSAAEGELAGLGDTSDYYNAADMMARAKESFPDEDVYYKIIANDEYATVVITTRSKSNVYFDKYVPVEGEVGDDDALYKLEIAMISDAMQPDDILQSHTGILNQD